MRSYDWQPAGGRQINAPWERNPSLANPAVEAAGIRRGRIRRGQSPDRLSVTGRSVPGPA